MYINDFIESQAHSWAMRERINRRAERKALALRVIKGLVIMLFAFILLLGAATFGYIAANVPGPATDTNYPMPSWWFTACMVTVGFIGFIAGVATCLHALDTIFLRANDPRRIFAKRSA